jgi:MoxR-like ATPase
MRQVKTMSDETPLNLSNNSKPFHPIFQGSGKERFQAEDLLPLPPPPTWRRADRRKKESGSTFQASSEVIEMVNAALYLRRPLLVTGKPGTGKTSLAYAVAQELGLGEVLYWPITTRTTLKDGLYLYDAIARLQDANSTRSREGEPINQNDPFKNVGDYIRLGPLGTALLPSKKPRVLIVDEIDKSDIDLPNDLLYVFEEGLFEIPELVRIENIKSTVEVRTAYQDQEKSASISGGKVVCDEFPLMILTSNGERDFPPPFLRRCLRFTMEEPDQNVLGEIVSAHLEQQGKEDKKQAEEDSEFSQDVDMLSAADREKLIQDFVAKRSDRSRGDLATDQLLNAIYLIMRERTPDLKTREDLINRLWKHLSSSEDQQLDRLS